MAIAFSVKHLTYRYPTCRAPVFKDLNLEIEAGTRVAVIGRSGVGKSTLLYLLGLLWDGTLEAGTIVYNDVRADFIQTHDYSQICDPGIQAQIRLEHFGFVFQSSALLTNLTCLENVAIPLILKGLSRRIWAPIAERLIKQVECIDGELSEMAGKSPVLSGGQRQRLAVLRAIVHNPRVVFADEPFSNLDHNNAKAIMNILALWQQGKLAANKGESQCGPRTLILATHDIPEAWELCDRFIIFGPEGNPVEDRVWTKAELQSGVGPDALAKWTVAH